MSVSEAIILATKALSEGSNLIVIITCWNTWVLGYVEFDNYEFFHLIVAIIDMSLKIGNFSYSVAEMSKSIVPSFSIVNYTSGGTGMKSVVSIKM